MTQTKLESLLESIVNVASGFFVSLAVWIFIVTPVWHIEMSMLENLAITGLFTIFSLARSYTWRRFFNAGIHRWIHEHVKEHYLEKKA